METEPSILHSAAGVMLGFLSRGCGERVSLSRSPVLNNKWPTNRPADGAARWGRANSQGLGGGGGGEGGVSLRPLVGVVCREAPGMCGITLQLVFSLKIACGDRARQSSGGAKNQRTLVKRSCTPSSGERERENKGRKIQLGAVQHFQRCQAR